MGWSSAACSACCLLACLPTWPASPSAQALCSRPVNLEKALSENAPLLRRANWPANIYTIHRLTAVKPWPPVINAAAASAVSQALFIYTRAENFSFYSALESTQQFQPPCDFWLWHRGIHQWISPHVSHPYIGMYYTGGMQVLTIYDMAKKQLFLLSIYTLLSTYLEFKFLPTYTKF